MDRTTQRPRAYPCLPRFPAPTLLLPACSLCARAPQAPPYFLLRRPHPLLWLQLQVINSQCWSTLSPGDSPDRQYFTQLNGALTDYLSIKKTPKIN